MNESLSDPPQGVLGRFISRDPIGHRGNLNLYAYPTNPVSFVDPAGLEPMDIVIHFKPIEVQNANNYLGTNFSVEALAKLWQARLVNEVGVDIEVSTQEGFHPDCETGKRFVTDDEGMHINLHLTNIKLLGIDPVGKSTWSRARVSPRVINEVYDGSFAGSPSAFTRSRQLEMGLYNTSMHELTHSLGVTGDYKFTKNFLGSEGTDMRGCIMSPKMSIDPAFFNKLMWYGHDNLNIKTMRALFRSALSK